ncbi:hypothetical protein SLEP1_g52614 [Rubroshorea leprosula]|uniref:Uncharacterized protein n=1 Tax=Rubroshorea leprosula TaxID=152421 RepID=A0AAV5M6Z3_9ROSI|nr:hypothetical protein SLEP1_g52614 [Rubroshorea leprosula]
MEASSYYVTHNQRKKGWACLVYLCSCATIKWMLHNTNEELTWACLLFLKLLNFCDVKHDNFSK